MEYNYNNIKFNSFKHRSYTFSSIKIQDLEKIRLWRNLQINVLRQNIKISEKQQKNYFAKIILNQTRLTKPKNILFKFMKKTQTIGYGGITNINWKKKTAEMSFLLNNVRATMNIIYKKEISIFIKLISLLAKNELKIKSLTTETYITRKKHIKYLEENNFKYLNKNIDKKKKKMSLIHLLEI